MTYRDYIKAICHRASAAGDRLKMEYAPETGWHYQWHGRSPAITNCHAQAVALWVACTEYNAFPAI